MEAGTKSGRGRGTWDVRTPGRGTWGCQDMGQGAGDAGLESTGT